MTWPQQTTYLWLRHLVLWVCLYWQVTKKGEKGKWKYSLQTDKGTIDVPFDAKNIKWENQSHNTDLGFNDGAEPFFQKRTKTI